MKKLFVSIVAVAAMAFTFTSCNKEENATGKNLNIPFEENEIMNDVKTHLEEIDGVFYVRWDNNDQIVLMDASRNTAIYKMINENGIQTERVFVRNSFGTFNPESSTLWAFYPTSLLYNRTQNEVNLPMVQNTTNGEVHNFPWYAQGTPNSPTFSFRNICGMERMLLTGDVAIDSISITTDQNLNGHFRVNINDLGNNMLNYGSSNRVTPAYGHGTKTNTLVFSTPLQLTSTPQEVFIYLPAGDYEKFYFNFYSNGQKYTIRNNSTININRTEYYADAFNLQSSRFADFENGTLPGTFKINATESVQFAQGNLEYISKNGGIWYFQDNQWDYVGKEQNGRSNAFDRDLFAWGATGRNGVAIWGVNSVYPYYQGGNTLTDTPNEWGSLPIRNGGNSEWRTLTASEMNYILNNHQNAIVTLGFVGVTGLIICPEGFSGTCPEGNITIAQWNQLEKAGCVFFAINNYRKNTGTFDNRISTTGTTSYFWLNNSDDNTTTAYALKVDAQGAQVVTDLHRQIGACVRLVKEVVNEYSYQQQ